VSACDLRFNRATLCYSAVLDVAMDVSVCLSVCHSQNGWTDQACFWHSDFSRLVLWTVCFKEIRVPRKI